jgi:hypothetical protein
MPLYQPENIRSSFFNLSDGTHLPGQVQRTCEVRCTWRIRRHNPIYGWMLVCRGVSLLTDPKLKSQVDSLWDKFWCVTSG